MSTVSVGKAHTSDPLFKETFTNTDLQLGVPDV